MYLLTHAYIHTTYTHTHIQTHVLVTCTTHIHTFIEAAVGVEIFAKSVHLAGIPLAFIPLNDLFRVDMCMRPCNIRIAL